jgi:tetratricopeptide (TPR) repeat protein
MIYFKRGEAYEALGEYEHAVQDFQRAETLFPHPEWKQRAWDARIRVERQGRRRETVQDRTEAGHVSRGCGLRIPSRHTSNGF